MKGLFTSESVTEGHPDKICDRIADSVLDEILKKDPEARVACEVSICPGLVHVMGEINTKCYVDIEYISRSAIKDIGYDSPECGFDADTCGMILSINKQSSDISLGVDSSDELEIGAGDQGIMFGYACNETKELMPLPIFLAHNLARKLSHVRKDGSLPYLMPDGKTQVTVEYDNDVPKRIDSVVVSAQHRDYVSMDQLRNDIKKNVIFESIPSSLIDENTKFFINPTGRFVIGGPVADSGLTGRKLAVDTYGGISRIGGGAFSGKDATKVDRSASYMARYIAKNIVASGISSKCEVQLAYAIGVSNPVSIMVDTFGTSKFEDYKIVSAINKVFDLRPGAIIKNFQLRSPIFSPLSSYGHMGREDLRVPWENTDKSDVIKSFVSGDV